MFTVDVKTTIQQLLPRRVTDILQCASPETGHGMAVVSFNGFPVAVCCILVINQKKLSMPRMTLNDICFEPGMSDFSTAALLRRIEAGALKAFHSYYFSRNGVGAGLA